MFDLLSLKILIFTPVLAAIIIASPLFGTNFIYIRRFAKTCGTIHFLYSLLFIVFYNFGVESFYDEIMIFGSGWLEKLGINAAFGLDGLTVLLAPLTSFIFLISLIVSKTMIRTKHKMYYSLMFILLSTVLGVFCSKDMFLFLIFWEAELIPLYFLISEWGSCNCKHSAMKYLLYIFCGSIFLSVAMIGLFFYGYLSNGELSASIDFLRVSMTDGIFPVFLKKLLFFGFFTGFAVKLPIIPFHIWFTDSQSDSATPISMVLSAIIINTGAYGIIRFNLDLFPELFIKYSPFIMIFAVINIIWASLAAFKQNDIKKTIAYYSISQMGLFLLGLSSLNKIGLDGAIFIMLSHSFISAGLFLITGLIYQVAKTKTLQELSGLGEFMPILMLFAYVINFAAVAVPLTIAFPGQLLVFLGAFSSDCSIEPLAKICSFIAILIMLLAASYIFKLFHKIFCTSQFYSTKKYHDVSGHRLMCIAVICFCIILFGCFPDSLMSIYNNFTESLLEILRV